MNKKYLKFESTGRVHESVVKLVKSFAALAE